MPVLKEWNVDALHTRVFATRAEMGECAGREAAQYLIDLLAQQEEANVMFAAAPSQNEVLETLRATPGIDWSRVNAFHMDEYIGLDAAHPAGFRNFLRRALFDRLPFKSVHLLDGNACDAQAAASAYDALLREHRLDLCLLGVGENGHVAFNDPPVADFADTAFVKIVTLDARCRRQQVNDGCFAALEQVPERALTVTVPGLMSAKRMLCCVPAPTKAQAVQQMLTQAVSTACPASILRTHPAAQLYLDVDSGRLVL